MQDLAKYLGTLAGLEYVHFSNTGFLTLAPSLNLLPDLRYLDLDGCNIGDTGMQTLAPCFKGINYLIGLNLSSNNLGPVGAKALADHFKDLPNLRIFKLDINSTISLEGIQTLASQLRHLAKLHALSLDNALVRAGAAGACVLAPCLRDLPRLLMLNLKSNNLTDEGVKDLIPNFQSLPKLSYLDLTDNHLHSVSAKSLVQYLNTIKKPKFNLYLGNNQLGDTGAQFFLNLSKDLNPCYMYLELNNISDEVVSKFQQLSQVELSHVKWMFKNPRHTTSCPAYTTFNFTVDDYKTSSKDSIIDSED